MGVCLFENLSVFLLQLQTALSCSLKLADVAFKDPFQLVTSQKILVEARVVAKGLHDHVESCLWIMDLLTEQHLSQGRCFLALICTKSTLALSFVVFALFLYFPLSGR
eukprot:TRINITY_DN7884_c0_g1_i7.p2 TRINITY_DN7884_c0_g1~~TRINITY_DN7884_c0_g1_i7.p2  ORF type:complete len:108 (+),score=12.55 TRINITY_DN7884_c0_g1_i7:398-721(+)